MDSTFFTWEVLCSMGGASLFVFYAVQYLKVILDRIAPKFPTDFLAVIVAYVTLVLSQIALGASVRDWRLFVLSFVNSFLVAATAGHMQNKVLNPPGSTKKENTNEQHVIEGKVDHHG